MSIFSRLFNKNGDGDEKEPATEETSADVKQGGSSRKPPPPGAATASTEGKPGTKRPPAPSFDITPPLEGSTAVPAAASPAANRADARAASRYGSAASRTLQYASPTPATTPGAAPDARASDTRSKANVTTARHGTPAGDPNAAPARPRAAAPPLPPAAQARPRTVDAAPSVSSNAANTGPAPTAVAKSRAADATANAAPEVARNPVHARRKPPIEAPVVQASAAAAAVEIAPVVMDPTDELLTLEFSSSPRQKVVPAPPAPPPPPAPAVAVARVALSTVAVPMPAPPPPPPPAPPAATAPEPDGAAFFSDLDEAFFAMVEPSRAGAPPKDPGLGATEEVRELFTALAANHMRQVRDFMIGLNWGEAPREALVVCEAATQLLLRAAREMELRELSQGLESYGETLKRIASSDAAISEGSAKDALVAAYAKLAEQMPAVFALEGERGQREAIIVHSLLQQVPEVRKVTIDKIYAAGLTGLEVLLLARPDEIAATTGIPEALAARIAEQFRRYREDAKQLADARHDTERKRLAELCVQLREVHERFESAAEAWSDRTQKKELRQARTEIFLQIKVLFARLGEVERLADIERLPFQGKIVETEKYLRDHKVELPGKKT